MISKVDVETFLRTSGFRILAYLLNMYIQKRGCSVTLLNHILQFCKSFKTFELKNLAFSSLIFNFELYYTCEIQLQKALISAIRCFFFEEGEKVSQSEQKHRVFYLFYTLSTFYSIEHALSFFFEDRVNEEKNPSNENSSMNINFIPSLASFHYPEVSQSRSPTLSRNNTVEIEENKQLNNLSDLIEIRQEIFKIIHKIISDTQDPQLFKEHINMLFQNIAKRTIGPSLIDLLNLLSNLLLQEGYLREKKSKDEHINIFKESLGDHSSPDSKKGSFRSPKRMKTDIPVTIQLDAIEEKNKNSKKKTNKQQGSATKTARVYSDYVSIVQEKNKLHEKLKMMDMCKLLISLLKNFKEENQKLISTKKILDPDNYSEKEEIDEFLKLILHLLFNFLIAETENEKPSIKEEDPLLSSEMLREPQQVSPEAQNRESKGKFLVDRIKVLDSLNVLLPEKFGIKCTNKILDAIGYSLKHNLNFESHLIMILFKRTFKWSPDLLVSFWSKAIDFTNKFEEKWLKTVTELPNFLIYLSTFYGKISKLDSSLHEAKLLTEVFLNKLLYFLFYQPSPLKYIQLFVLISEEQMSKNLEIVITLVTCLIEKFRLEFEAIISQWRSDKVPMCFDRKVNQMLLNLIYFLNFVESLTSISCNTINNKENLELF